MQANHAKENKEAVLGANRRYSAGRRLCKPSGAGLGILRLIGGEPVRRSCDVQQDGDGRRRGLIGGEMEGMLSGCLSEGMFSPVVNACLSVRILSKFVRSTV